MKTKKNIKKDFGFDEVRVHMGIFDYSVLCIVGDYKNVEAYAQWKFEDKDFRYDAGGARGCCVYRNGFVPVIWIPRKPRTPREHATLAHECLHAVYHLFAWASMPMTRDTEEVVTHSMSHLITGILSEI